MSIANFIRESVFLPRLQKLGYLVVYDPERRYQNLCNALANDKLLVVDASASSIESRVAATLGMQRVVSSKLTGLLVYVPHKAPETDEKRQVDPFASANPYRPKAFR